MVAVGQQTALVRMRGDCGGQQSGSGNKGGSQQGGQAGQGGQGNKGKGKKKSDTTI